MSKPRVRKTEDGKGAPARLEEDREVLDHLPDAGAVVPSIGGSHSVLAESLPKYLARRGIIDAITRVVGLLAGTFVCYLGYDLFLKGVTGAFDFKGQVSGFNGQLLSGSPGLFFALLGFVVIVVSIRATKVSHPWHLADVLTQAKDLSQHKYLFTEQPRPRVEYRQEEDRGRHS